MTRLILKVILVPAFVFAFPGGASSQQQDLQSSLDMLKECVTQYIEVNGETHIDDLWKACELEYSLVNSNAPKELMKQIDQVIREQIEEKNNSAK